MGEDKAFLRLGRLTLLEHMIATAKGVCEAVVLIGDKQRLSPYGSVVQDTFPGHGPLAGIHAALTSTACRELNLMLAVDTPALPAEFLDFLVSAAESSRASVTVPRVGGFTQSLCAVYRSEFASHAARALEAGRNKIDRVFDEVPTTFIEPAQWKHLGFNDDIFDNVNTPEDWQRMRQKLGATH